MEDVDQSSDAKLFIHHSIISSIFPVSDSINLAMHSSFTGVLLSIKKLVHHSLSGLLNLYGCCKFISIFLEF